MIKLYILAVTVLCTGLLHAQSISSSVMSASGTSFEAENFTLHFAIGEPLNTLIEEGDLTISQGVLQIILNEITPVEETSISNIFEVYPNPTTDIVSIKIGKGHKNYDCQLFDMKGTLIHEASLSNEKSSFNMEHLPKATYLLKIFRDNELYQNVKLIKL